MPSPVRFAEVRKMLESKGYVYLRSKDSHFHFVKPGVGTFTVPVHNNLVKAAYVKKIQKL
jgi:predicted RNA binding protein YcfA (HicA-like mRNA interferase family)